MPQDRFDLVALLWFGEYLTRKFGTLVELY